MTSIEPALRRFRTLNPEMRLQLLLNHARKFPELPEDLQAARDEGLNRVHECQTPLFLWVGVEGGGVRIHADAPRDAPTVRGFMSFLMETLNGATPEEVAALPADILDEMGLAEVLGIVRTRGLGAVLHRIRSDVARAASPTGTSAPEVPPQDLPAN